MAIPHADKLLDLARAGDKLNVVERRHAITYLMATGDDTSNVALGALFQVSEKIIRSDKIWIREEKSKLITHDDVSLVIADIALNFERQQRDLEAAKRALGKTDKGRTSRTYVQICISLFNMELQKVKALQDLGYYPKNLGVLTTNTFEYTATVSVMGEGPSPKKIEARTESAEVLDAEFASEYDEVEVKLLEPPVDTNP